MLIYGLLHGLFIMSWRDPILISEELCVMAGRPNCEVLLIFVLRRCDACEDFRMSAAILFWR